MGDQAGRRRSTKLALTKMSPTGEHLAGHEEQAVRQNEEAQARHQGRL